MDEPGIVYLSQQELDSINNARHDAIEPEYEKYKNGDFDLIGLSKPSSLILLPPTDLTVKIDRDTHSNEPKDVEIRQTSNPEAYNFMGFYPEDSCAVFRGEAGLFDAFIDFTSELAKGKDTKAIFRATTEIRVPSVGLEDGLSYQEFAARVEIVEFAMWVEPVYESEEPIDDFLWKGCPTPRSSQVDLPLCLQGDIERSCMSIHGASEEEMIDENATSPHEHDLTDDDSSSTLSPPPEVITTPPHMKHLFSPRQETSENDKDELQTEPRPQPRKKTRSVKKRVKR